MSKVKFCPECGCNIENLEGNFCPECGHKISNNTTIINKNIKNIDNTKREDIVDNKENVYNDEEYIKVKAIDSNKEVETRINNNYNNEEEYEYNEHDEQYIEYDETQKKGYMKFVILAVILLFGLFYYLYSVKGFNFWGILPKNNSSSEVQTLSSVNSSETNSGKLDGSYIGDIESSDDILSGGLEDELVIIEDDINNTYEVIVDKAYFYPSADSTETKSSYLVRGDILEISPAKSGNTKFFAQYTNSSGIKTEGFIRKSDLREISREEIDKQNLQDERNKSFLRMHYSQIDNKDFSTAYSNYLYPKAKSVSDFASWYKGVYSIELGNIENIGRNEYKYTVTISEPDGIHLYETKTKVGELDGTLKILGYGSKKIR